VRRGSQSLLCPLIETDAASCRRFERSRMNLRRDA
jgi:hypothetical protein